MTSRLVLFPKTAEIGRDGHLNIGGYDVIELANRFGTPLYIFDEVTLRDKCHQFKNEFGKRYEDITVTYAGKAFLNRALLSIIKDEGLGLDVVSGGELAIAESVRFPMEMVYFHGNNKTAEEIKQAMRQHVGRIVVDNYDELKMLAEIADETGHISDILLRITPGIDPHTHQHITTGKFDSKFGFALFDAADAVAQAMTMPSLSLVGFHFHIGSLIFETQPYQEAIELLIDFAADMAKRYGLELEELNIGGGFALQYEVDSPAPHISEYAKTIVTSLVEKCEEREIEPPSLTIEPGRSLIGQSGVALYRVGAIKDITGIRRYISVDGGMADNMRPALYGAKYEAVVANKMSEKEQQKVTIAGKYCESGDILAANVDLPKIESGDLIAIPDCGAYCLPLASNYNASLKPAIVLVNKGEARLIRRRETFEDLIRLDILELKE
jgi:diaminopimelate decarboxylase